MSGEGPVKTDIERFLEENGTLSYRFRGVSMMPLLRQGRDIFTVEKKGPERCSKYDVVLYRSGSKLLLHRIVEVRPDSYVILGDNNVFKEYGIRDSDILGVMTSFNRGGRQISCGNGLYRLYSKVWYVLYPVRKPV
ncbi:MAG: S24/S26 family peptidase, partial [Firmicutes bacterium]|nr:S24/S26 family peptidase [Bacillota bacterium]